MNKYCVTLSKEWQNFINDHLSNIKGAKKGLLHARVEFFISKQLEANPKMTAQELLDRYTQVDNEGKVDREMYRLARATTYGSEVNWSYYSTRTSLSKRGEMSKYDVRNLRFSEDVEFGNTIIPKGTSIYDAFETIVNTGETKQAVANYMRDYVMDLGTSNYEKREKSFLYQTVFKPLFDAFYDMEENKELLDEFTELARGKTLSEEETIPGVMQARAYAERLNGMEMRPVNDGSVNLSASEVSAFSNNPDYKPQLRTDAASKAYSDYVRADREALISQYMEMTLNQLVDEYTESYRTALEALKNKPDKTEEDYELMDVYVTFIDNLTPVNVINTIGVDGFLQEVKNRFIDPKAAMSLERVASGIAADFLKERGMAWDSLTEDQKIKLEVWAKEQAAHRVPEFAKMANPEIFKELANSAATLLKDSMGIVVGSMYAREESELLLQDQDSGEDLDSASYMEEHSNGGYNKDARSISSHDTMSKEIRKLISKLPQVDVNGCNVFDDLGNYKCWDSGWVHANLLQIFKEVSNFEEFKTSLENAAKTKPWVATLLWHCNQDEYLLTKLYTDLRMDYMVFSVIKTSYNKNGEQESIVMEVNRRDGYHAYFADWKNNVTNNIVLNNELSAYDSHGNATPDAVKDLRSKISALRDSINQLDVEESKKLIAANIDSIYDAMMSIGAAIDKDRLNIVLTSFSPEEYHNKRNPIETILHSLSGILESTTDGNIVTDDETSELSFFNRNATKYREVAKLFDSLAESMIEDSVFQNGSRRYSFGMPSFLTKLVKALKNYSNNPEKFAEYLQNEFGQYSQFTEIDPEGLVRYTNDIITSLSEDAEFREKFHHSVLLEAFNTDYSNWNTKQRASVIWQQFNAYVTKKNASPKFMNVPVFVLSDTNSSEFVTLKRYNSDDYSTYQDKIIPKLVDVVKKEILRIQIQKQRLYDFNNGLLSEKERRASFDINSEDEAEFKMIPFLNNYTVDIGEGSISFLKATEQIQQSLDFDGDQPELRSQLNTIIENAIKEAMKSGFEEFYSNWANDGVFEDNTNENDVKTSKYLSGVTPLSNEFQELISTLKAIQNKITSPATQAKAKKLASALSNNKYVPLAERQAIINEVLDNSSNLEPTQEEKLEAGLREASHEDALREFYWNFVLGQSQLLELTITDLAYYKNLEDFQKRNKELHASYKQLNTEAVFNGKKVGRKKQHTMHISDNYVMSQAAEEVRVTIEEAYKAGRITKENAAYIIAQFGAFNVIDDGVKYYQIEDYRAKSNLINETDAQAFRSVSSYRAVQCMIGEWTMRDEEAYEELLNDEPVNLNKLAVTWQTKKPYSYGYEAVKYRDWVLKMPHQHKNSEMLLLYMHKKIMHSLGKKSNLAALNQFMEDHGIDMVQFPSASKVAHPNPVNISRVPQRSISSTNYTAEDFMYDLQRRFANNEITQDELAAEIEKINNEGIVSYSTYDAFLSNKVVDKKTDYNLDNYNQEMKVFDTTPEEVYQILTDYTGLTEPNQKDDFLPGSVEVTSYADYGIQVATPEHLVGKTQAIGTQIMKLIMSDLNNEDNRPKYSLGGKNVTAKQLYDKYCELLTEEILQHYRQVDKIFQDPKEVQKALIAQLRDDQGYDPELEKALVLKNGVFRIPLNEPIQAERIQRFLYSIIRNRVTKIETNGGTAIQTSHFGYSRELNIVFSNGEKEITMASFLRENPGKDKADFKAWAEAERAKGNLHIVKLECFLPATHQDMIEACMNPDGSLNIEKLPEELRYLIGYRVPTEDKYSMAPLYVKGFTPAQNGSIIVLPQEITLLSGSDFDVDKMFLIIPHFKTKKRLDTRKVLNSFVVSIEDQELKEEAKRAIDEYRKAYDNKRKLESRFYKDHKEAVDAGSLEGKTIDQVFAELDPENYAEYSKKIDIRDYLSDTLKAMLADFYEKVEDDKKYLKATSLEYAKPDFSKAAKDMTHDERANGIIECMRSVLTNSDTTTKILNPGGFDPQKKSSRIMSILKNTDADELIRVIKDVTKTEVEPTYVKNGKTLTKSRAYLVGEYAELLEKLDLGTIEKIYKRTKKRMNPLDPNTQVRLQHLNMVGKQLISIFANQNSNHALIQHTGLALRDGCEFTLFGQMYTSLHNIHNINGDVITRLVSGYLAAAVDNGKDPVLGELGINIFTASIVGYLSRLGYTSTQVGTFLCQPAISDIADSVMNADYASEKKKAVSSTIHKYRNILLKLGMKESELKTLTKPNVAFKGEHTMIQALGDIATRKEIEALDFDNLSDEDRTKVKSYYIRQYQMARLFKIIQKQSDQLEIIGKAMKPDGGSGSIGYNNANVLAKMENMNAYHDLKSSKDCQFRGMDFINNNIEIVRDEKGNIANLDEIRETLLREQLPFTAAFQVLGFDQGLELMKQLYPELTSTFTDVFDMIKKEVGLERVNADLYADMINELYTYLLGSIEFFGDSTAFDVDTKGNQVTRELSAEEKRKTFINKMPAYLNTMKSAYKEVRDNDFIKVLKFEKPNKNRPVPIITLNRAANLKGNEVNLYRRAWEALVQSDNPEVRNVGWSLVKYGYYRSGFGFGPSTYMHLCPLSIKEAIPNYIDTIRDIDKIKFDKQAFIDQFIRNHLHDYRFSQKITAKQLNNLIDKENSTRIFLTLKNYKGNESAWKPIFRDDKLPRFVSVTEKGETSYYTFIADPTHGMMLKKITPLGVENQFLEYSFVAEGEDKPYYIESAIRRNYIQGMTEEELARYKDSYKYDKEEALNRRITRLIEKLYNKVKSKVGDSEVGEIVQPHYKGLIEQAGKTEGFEYRGDSQLDDFVDQFIEKNNICG